jgi:hypothetical protein
MASREPGSVLVCLAILAWCVFLALADILLIALPLAKLLHVRQPATLAASLIAGCTVCMGLLLADAGSTHPVSAWLGRLSRRARAGASVFAVLMLCGLAYGNAVLLPGCVHPGPLAAAHPEVMRLGLMTFGASLTAMIAASALPLLSLVMMAREWDWNAAGERPEEATLRSPSGAWRDHRDPVLWATLRPAPLPDSPSRRRSAPPARAPGGRQCRLPTPASRRNERLTAQRRAP